MEEVNRPIVPGYKSRKSHYHYFAGSGIPKLDGLTSKTLNGLEFYPGELKSNYSVFDTISFDFKAKNEHAGHRVPTGDPERFIIIDFKILNSKGEEVAHKEERIGEKWQWHPEAKKLSDNNFDPLEERVYQFNQSKLKTGSFTLVVEVTKHRMTQKTAEYNKLGDNYPLFISIYKKEYQFDVFF